MGRNHSADPIKKIGSPPPSWIALFTSPDRGERTTNMMPTTTTVEMNAGEYSTVWVNFLNLSLWSWLTSKARMIGTGKATSRPSSAIHSVFPMTWPNW